MRWGGKGPSDSEPRRGQTKGQEEQSQVVEEPWESELQEERKGVLGIFPSACPLCVHMCICV